MKGRVTRGINHLPRVCTRARGPRAVMVASLWLALGAPSARGDEISDLANMAIDAALDDRAALYSLGVRFYAGEGVQQSRENAAVLWRKAAAAGSVGAMNNLGFLLFHGLGVKLQ